MSDKKNVVDFPISEAFGELYGHEWDQIKERFGVQRASEISSDEEFTQALIWQFERRSNADYTFEDVKRNFKIKELSDYFMPEPLEPEDETTKK